ncbi:MAG TPA: sulfite exporter TauE/SafE family protein [Polyangiales bacterium]
MTLWLILAAAGFAAGVINAIAGGGSLLSFPALLLTGMSPIVANATNTVAVWPGSLSSAWAYRGKLAEHRQRVWLLAWPSLIGGLLGSFIVLHTSERVFAGLVPWLIIFACVLLALQPRIARLLPPRAVGGRHALSLLWIAQFLIAIYGGYFGAGMGILTLAALAILLRGSLQDANAIKVFLALLINGIAALYFLASGAGRLPEAAVMALASLAGGYVGARLAQRLPAALMRWLVVVYGLCIALRLAYTL